MDKVFIEQLEVITTIGVYDWEQQIKQNWCSIWKWRTTTVQREKVMM